jgi:hypothetical protein
MGCASAGIPNASANASKHAALSNANAPPTQKCPAVAAAMIPTPIRARVKIGPLAKARGEKTVKSTSIKRTGTTTPTSAVVHHAEVGQVTILKDVKNLIATILT